MKFCFANPFLSRFNFILLSEHLITKVRLYSSQIGLPTVDRPKNTEIRPSHYCPSLDKNIDLYSMILYSLVHEFIFMITFWMPYLVGIPLKDLRSCSPTEDRTSGICSLNQCTVFLLLVFWVGKTKQLSKLKAYEHVISFPFISIILLTTAGV